MGLRVGSDGLGRPGGGRAALWGAHLERFIFLGGNNLVASKKIRETAASASATGL
jgi:hypothetical protein